MYHKLDYEQLPDLFKKKPCIYVFDSFDEKLLSGDVLHFTKDMSMVKKSKCTKETVK